MAFNLFGAPKRRSRSSGGGGGKALDTVLAIGVLGALGVGGYFLLKNSKSVEDALKSFVDAGNSTGDWIADGSYWLQKQLGIGNTPGGRGEEKNIIEKLSDPVTKDVAATKRDIESKQKKYIDTWKPWADAVDSSVDAIRGLGCGVIRKC
jgi:hypothetical protein